jgi:hypothetical protein
MDTKKWQSNEKQIYYDTGFGTDVTETGETLPADAAELARNTGQSHKIFWHGNIWLVATCLAYGVEVLGYGISPRTNNWEWMLNDDDGRVTQLAREYKVPGEMVCPVHDIQNGYRTASKIRAEARRGERNDWHGRRTA